jgi:ribonuclease HI
MPYKSPGKDKIRAIFLQKGQEILLPHLVRLFRWSYALGYLPTDWAKVKVVFIPKAGGRDAEQPKSYRPISLTSVILKTMEKLIDLHIKTDFLNHRPLHCKQFAYQAGKSTLNALHHVVKRVESAIEHKEIALAAFIDIEGAFDNAGFDSIQTSAANRGLGSGLVKWMSEMLKCRRISSELGGIEITIEATRGCPQGGVLSPLMWSLVIDDLLQILENQGFEVVGFADDLVIIVRGKHDETISDRMQLALNLTSNWCREQKLVMNPNKTILVPFTTRLKNNLKRPSLNNIEIEFSKEVKYLGVILDSKLNWNSQINNLKLKATKALMSCKRFLGRNWGLKPRIIHWIYTCIVRPMISYGSFVWWPKTDQRKTKETLSKVQRLAMSCITGCRRTTPTVALEILLDLPPLHTFIIKEAAKTSYRLYEEINPKPGNYKGHLKIYEKFQNLVDRKLISDSIPLKYDFEHKFDVIFPERKDWHSNKLTFKKRSIFFFTDGSKKDEHTGAGIYGPGMRLWIPMGTMATVFQAEVHAIEVCARRCLNRQYLERKHIVIASDSQAALRALNKSTFHSKQVLECKRILNKLGDKCFLTLTWVPGHEGVMGNEKADELAKRGSETEFIGPEPFLGFSLGNYITELEKWEWKCKKEQFRMLGISSHSRNFLEINKKKAEEALALSKPDLRLLIGILTGHCELNAHMKRIGRSEVSLCRFCKKSEETPLHILCECEAIARVRLEQISLGNGFPTISNIKQTDPQQILSLFKKLGLGNV